MSESPRILVVDDTEANRYAVSRHLRKAGYTVLEASDGRRALERVAVEQPDLMVLDIRMPNMDGFEVVRRLRQDPRTLHLPVLHVSASFTDPASQAEGLESGADGYLTHPVEPMVLIATVRSLLRARTAEREARRAEAVWRSTFEAIADGVCVVDATGRIERCNAAFEHVVGSTGLKDRSLADLIPDSRDGAGSAFRRRRRGAPLGEHRAGAGAQEGAGHGATGTGRGREHRPRRVCA